MKNLQFGSILTVACIIATTGAQAVAAASADTWTVRAVAGLSLFAGPSDIPSDEDRVTIGPEDDFALGLEVEYRLNERIGIELGILDSQPTYTLGIDLADGPRVELTDDSKFLPVTTGLTFHLTPDRAADVTLTPMIGIADYGNQHYDLGGASATLTVGSRFIWGGRLAVDMPIGEEGWAVSVGARYLDASIDGDDPDGQPIEIDLDPVLLTLGIGYSF